MIPVARPAFSDAELTRVAEVFDSRWLGQGAVTAEFERSISERVDGRPFLAVNTGTTAMHLALTAIGIGPGDDVVLPSLTFVATAQAVVAAGARPVLCDIDPATLNVNVDCLERALTPRTRAVIPVHYRGLPADLDEILAWAGERNIRVVEDAAHAFGSVYPDGTPVGGKGDVTCFSFDPIKNVTTGEGGGIVFARAEERERAARMAVLGIDSTAWGRLETKRPWSYDVAENGFRYHMPNFCAAIGLAQLERFDEHRARKQTVLARYQEAFHDLPYLELREMPVERCFPFLALVLVDDRDRFMGQMKERGIGTGVHYIPSHR
ncbi:MAG TPA: DegT/DnrJ/EryC1/StrS family aminotransferase, partial [Gaiellaceae bacterium]|nr:DegT/DnrJ/EryC1/StrS family aminotransferase [Gaiellaceae bacterium]